jgi:hypothetical protein
LWVSIVGKIKRNACCKTKQHLTYIEALNTQLMKDLYERFDFQIGKRNYAKASACLEVASAFD